ncbi:hypothetical protein [Prochlorothrix hollandica]|uniref:hypothetical protein n=1 Tax=Prochlorothrix hollandica TaxID=1223 RepID=UPI00333E2972
MPTDTQESLTNLKPPPIAAAPLWLEWAIGLLCDRSPIPGVPDAALWLSVGAMA